MLALTPTPALVSVSLEAEARLIFFCAEWGVNFLVIAPIKFRDKVAENVYKFSIRTAVTEVMML